MILADYQQQVAAGCFVKPGTDLMSHLALGLTGESGEVADTVKKGQYEGRTFDVEHAREELGDAFWYLTAMSIALGMSLEELALVNLKKLANRYPGRYTLPSQRNTDPSQLELACVDCGRSYRPMENGE